MNSQIIIHLCRRDLLVTCATLSILFSSFQSFSQTPQLFSYQAALRNGSGEVLVSEAVVLRFTIQTSISEISPVKYQETQNFMTSEFGLINCTVGNGNVVQGDFTTVDWNTGVRFLKIEVDEGVGYTVLGVQQLISVPYALASLTSVNTVNAWCTAGNSDMTEDNAIGTADAAALNFKVNNQKSGRISPTGSTYFG